MIEIYNKRGETIVFHLSLSVIDGVGLEWSATHATGGADGRKEGCECGYYHLHRNLCYTFLIHMLPPFLF